LIKGIPERGDIWHIDLEPTKGVEQNGSRPIVVLSSFPFNRLGLILSCPVTQGDSVSRDKGFAVSLTGCGSDTQGVVLCHQVRSMDYRKRNARFKETLPGHITAEIIARTMTLLE
jgi:mRNA-degrading endonuclease toxin of MazEF toxin-antitoxin module